MGFGGQVYPCASKGANMRDVHDVHSWVADIRLIREAIGGEGEP